MQSIIIFTENKYEIRNQRWKLSRMMSRLKRSHKFEFSTEILVLDFSEKMKKLEKIRSYQKVLKVASFDSVFSADSEYEIIFV